MKLAVCLLVIAACERAPAPAKTIVTSAPAPAPAPGSTRIGVPAAHYAALFRRGAAWRYTVTTSSELYDPDDPHADHDGMLREKSTAEARCTVVEAHTWSRGVMSRVECDPSLGDNDPLAGAWVADGHGLYKVDDLPAPGATPALDDDHLVIAATPAEGKHGDPDGTDFGQATEVTHEADAWCATHSMWGGDDGYATLCFARDGVTSGASGWSGGSTHDTTFDLIR